MASARKSPAGPRKKKTPAGAAAGAWWGEGPPPTETWPGVTIPIDDRSGRYRFDATQADRVCAWFPRFCSHSKGRDFAGKPLDLLPYQTQLILRPLFGWVRADDGLRRFRKAFIEIPKKQGKTTLVAGLALYMLLADNEPGAEVYVAAADREQARILFSAAKAMVEANAALSKRLIVYRNSIVRKDDPAAFFQVLSAESATKHGFNIHCLIIDELHAQPDRELFETLTRGVIARRQPLTLLITTAGDDEESICYEEYDYARGVLSGTITDEHHLPVIFEAKPDDDFQSPAVWRRVNPGLGITVEEEALQTFATEAANEPRKRNDFLRYHLNRWVNQSTAWIPVDWWDACSAPLPDEATLGQYPCVLGVDMSQKIDLTAASLVFMLPLPKAQKADAIEITGEDEGGALVKRRHSLNYQIAILPKFWLPEATLEERVKQDRVRYDLYEELGELETTEGVTIDPDAVVTYVKDETGRTRDLVSRFPLLKQGRVGYDPAFATVIGQRLTELGLTTVEVLQGYKYLSEACMVLEALIKAGRVIHGGHRLLRSHVENVAVRRDDAGRIKPVKPKKSTKRIDGIVSVLIALSQLMVMPMPRPRSRGRGVGLRWTPTGFEPIAGATEGGEAHA